MVKVRGHSGDFRVTLHRTPRYIDASRCTACGDCAEVCPVILPNEYDQGLTLRKAVHKKYAQAIPGAYAITKSGTAPCKAECPAHISVQGYVALVAQGKYLEALKLIKEENPLPAICGRVCHHPCETVCTRGQIDEPVAIDSIKRFVADLDLYSDNRYQPEIKDRKEEKIAIIGSGPAGLSCAYYLAKEGYQVVIYEKLPVAGGMLAVGIPEYRLPRAILQAEIQAIRDMGVDIRVGVELGKDITIGQLRKQGNKAVFMGIGAHACKIPGIEGEDLKGVYSGIDFLRQVNMGEQASVGERVAVIGGGNVAIDAVRSAKRLGARDAFIIYRRGLEEMPAISEEIEDCKEEGIQIRTLTNPKRIIGKKGRVKAIECVQMALGDLDESGRRRPRAIEGSEFILQVDGVIHAIGQESDWACLDRECACILSDKGTVSVDPLTLQTDDPDIFAGGDAVTGPGNVIEAIEAGKQAAVSIDRFIRGADLREGREKIWRASQDTDCQGYRPFPRQGMPRLAPDQRIQGFKEVRLGFNEKQALSEAGRCLECGICSECYQCVEVCGAKAVTLETHAQEPEDIELEAGSIILAPGYQAFDPSGLKAYGYTKCPNIITSIEFERMLSATGPSMGHIIRPSDGKTPKKIAWIQCVGSRDTHQCDHGYCSSVCCMYAIKEAVVAKEHAGADLDCAIFFIDMRTHGKDFERYYDEARKRHGVRFIRSRVPAIECVDKNNNLIVPYVDENEKTVQESFDLVVLSVGMETAPDMAALSRSLGIDLTEGRFCDTKSFYPVTTSRDGVFVCGAFRGPMDIPQSVIEASSAAAEAGAKLEKARHTLAREKEVSKELDIRGERPRIGVFVCQCGINIGGIVDVPSVRDYAASLPFVEYASDNLYTCSQDTQEAIALVIREKGLNRVVVAACTPRTHESLFQETMASSGLNRYLFEMANIRNQDSWVHRDEPHLATQKAKDLVRMAVAKAALLEPLEENEVEIRQRALVVGGGISGMVAARNLSEQGFEVLLVEKTSLLGGQAINLYRTWKGEDVQAHLLRLTNSVQSDPKIKVRLETEICNVEGFVGNFKTTLSSHTGEEGFEHGIAVIATGAQELKTHEYLHGKDPRVVTHLELDRKFLNNDPSLHEIRTAVFIQCVGSREPERPYCSRVCCTHSIESALHLKEINPDMNIFILYRDIRTYGEREYLYREARLAGIIFIPFSLDQKPKVSSRGQALEIEVRDNVLGQTIVIEADLLSLATAIVPYRQDKLARMFKLPVNNDGFYIEAHAKLAPSDFATSGLFVAGMAHYPKPIDESTSQALAAASRAVTLLARKSVRISGLTARVNPALCSGCGVCSAICPYSAAMLVEKGQFFGTAEVNPAQCKGCGLCVASCRSGAMALGGFDEAQVIAMINEA